MTAGVTAAAASTPSLRRHTVWLAAGNTVYAVSQWGMLAVAAKLGSPELVGRLAFGFAVAVPITLLTGLQLRGLQATDARETTDFSDVLTLRLVTACLGIVLIAVLGMLGPWSRSAAMVVILVGLAKTVDGISEVCHGALQRRERHDAVARSLLLRGPLAVAGLALGIALTGSIEIGAIGLLLASVLVLGLHDLPGVAACMRGEGALMPRWRQTELGRLAKTALPLGLVAMLVSLTPYVPRYALERHLGEYHVGVFAALASVVAIGATLVSAAGQAATPRLAQAYAAGDRQRFTGLTAQLIGTGLALGLGLVLLVGVAGGSLITLLYTREYASYLEVLLWLTVSGAVGYVASFLGYAVTASLSFRPQVPLFVFVAAVMALGCHMLVPAKGLVGAAWAVAAAMVIQAIGLAILWIRLLPSRAEIVQV